jgi:hypothetical protein
MAQQNQTRIEHSMLGNATPAVLANVGVPVSLYRTRVINTEHIADDELVEYKVRFTNWTISQLEEQFSSMTNWDRSLTDQPFRTIIRTLAIALEWPPQRVAAAMPMGHITEYQLAVHAALQLALGADPKKVAKALNETLGQVTQEDPKATETFSVNLDDSPSSTFGSDGSGAVETQTSSGPAHQAKSEQSSTPWPM